MRTSTSSATATRSGSAPSRHRRGTGLSGFWTLASTPAIKVVVDGTQKIFPGAKVSPVAYNAASDSTIKPMGQDVPAAPAFPLASGR